MTWLFEQVCCHFSHVSDLSERKIFNANSISMQFQYQFHILLFFQHFFWLCSLMRIDIKILFSASLDISLYPLMSKNRTKLSCLCSHIVSCYNLFTVTLGLKSVTSFRLPSHVCLESSHFLTFCSLYIMAYFCHQYFTTGLTIDFYNFKCVLLKIIIPVSL